MIKVISMKVNADHEPETQKAIVNAFWRLYEEKSLESISVKDITLQAGCNRSTFYTYFNNAYEVLEHIEGKLLEKVHNAFFTGSSKPGYSEILDHDVDDFKAESRYLAVLLGENGDPKFAKKLRDLFCYTEDELICESLSIREATYAKEFMMGGFTYVMTKWFETGCHSPVEEIAKVMKAFKETESKLFAST